MQWTSTEWLFVHRFQIELKFGVLVFVEGGKPENREKNPHPQSKAENQQQTQPTYDAVSLNRTKATLVGGECSHHCTIPASGLPLCQNESRCETILMKMYFTYKFILMQIELIFM